MRADGDRMTASAAAEPGVVYPVVLSIGYNPFYKNTVRSVVRALRACTTTINSAIRPQGVACSRDSADADSRKCT